MIFFTSTRSDQQTPERRVTNERESERPFSYITAEKRGLLASFRPFNNIL